MLEPRSTHALLPTPYALGSSTNAKNYTLARPTWITISGQALAHNLELLRARLPQQTLLAVVKANAYGHGLVPVAQQLESLGIAHFGVALLEEGIMLRASGIKGDILVMNGAYGNAHQHVRDYQLTPVVYRLDDLHAFAKVGLAKNTGVHLKVDTGMHRLGIPHQQLDEFLNHCNSLHTLRITGLMTHFATASSNQTTMQQQVQRFRQAHQCLHAHGHDPEWIHTANSDAALGGQTIYGNMVRLGLPLYGYEREKNSSLKPALNIKSRILGMHWLNPGDGVGYDHRFVATHKTHIATVAIGYADGIPHTLSNRGSVLIRGQHCPIIGAISMDLMGVDISTVSKASIGDEVTVLGREDQACISAQDIAAQDRGLVYDVLTRLSPRVPRFYEHFGQSSGC